MAGLFDEKLVRFMWTDKLKGKKVFVADNINSLIERVEKGAPTCEVHWSKDMAMPFEREDFVRYHFAYYDPNYRIKKAFNEGKKVQLQISESCWKDISSCSDLLFVCNTGGVLRIKPEEKKWIAYLARKPLLDKSCYLTSCHEDMWESVQKTYGAKTKLFIGAENEVEEWYKSRQKFAEVIKAWEDGKTIQSRFGDRNWTIISNPLWDLYFEYRVKPEEKEEEMKDKMNPMQGKKMRRYNLKVKDWDELKEMAVKMFKGIAALNERFARKISGDEFITQDDWKIMNDLWRTFNYTNDDNQLCKEDLHHLFTDYPDEEFVEIKAEEAEEKKDEKPQCLCEDRTNSKACVGCEQSDDGEPHPFENYYCYGCDKFSKKEYRQYNSSAEMIEDFVNRFKAGCPPYAEPLIWVKDKQLDCRYLITAFMPFDVEIGSLLYKFKQLFDEYTYLDGSPCGKRVGGND